MVWAPPAPRPTTSRPRAAPDRGTISARISAAMARKKGSQTCEVTQRDGRPAAASLSYRNPPQRGDAPRSDPALGEPPDPGPGRQGRAGDAYPGRIRGCARSADRPRARLG